MIDKLRNVNAFVLIAGIGIGAFLHAMLRPPENFAAAASADKEDGWIVETEDTEVLKSQIELMAAENRELRSDLNASNYYWGSELESTLARSKGAKNVSELIDYAKPLFRELILPELRANRKKSIQDGIENALAGRADRLNLSDAQRQLLEERIGEQQKEDMNELERILMDDESSLTAFFQEQWELERGGDPEVDDIFLEVLDTQQREIYTNIRLEENAARVTEESEQQLNDLDRAIELDEAQKDAIFPLLARSAPGYREEMVFEGIDVSNTQPIAETTARDEAIQSVLRPDQMEAWEDYQRRQQILGGFGVPIF